MNQLPSSVDTLNGINGALNQKAANVTSLNVLNQKLAESKKNLVEAKNSILNEYNDTSKHPDGQKELGGNEASRSAAIDSMTVAERAAVETFELQLTKAQGELAVAQIEVDRWRYTLRLLEVEASSRVAVH
jgi:RNA polymerase-binding transcription factor DksA